MKYIIIIIISGIFISCIENKRTSNAISVSLEKITKADSIYNLSFNVTNNSGNSISYRYFPEAIFEKSTELSSSSKEQKLQLAQDSLEDTLFNFSGIADSFLSPMQFEEISKIKKVEIKNGSMKKFEFKLVSSSLLKRALSLTENGRIEVQGDFTFYLKSFDGIKDSSVSVLSETFFIRK
jgi:hypothetical protein